MDLSTARPHFQEALCRNEKKYRYPLERSYVVILLVDRELNITYVYDSVTSILKIKPAELLGRNLFEALNIVEHRRLSYLLDTLVQPGSTASSLREELSIETEEGTMHFDAAITNLLEDPVIAGFAFYLHNITDRKRSEEQLSRLNFELDSFVYKASHDMRAPLVNILGLIDIAQRDFPIQAMQYMDMMKRSVLRLDKFIFDLTQYSRNDRTKVESEKIDMSLLIMEAMEGQKFLPQFSSIDFEIDIRQDHPIYSDISRLRIILNNLLSNSIKYHDLRKEDPYIRISIWENPKTKEFVIQVKDNGIGIMEHYTDRVFDMFFRASDMAEGSGLGLYLVKKVVEKLKGKIDLKTREREGTMLTITLPNTR
ncbi:PAS domain-containing sensor histidine kinase [Xanthocytophaga agilis]|uniref:histidine kinase n=1 Tax=Xanthocytophaga agilis TaxID=3048010 RepID=A0AAE3UIC6_9BACT|nr:PAS domain-containing sensor histidine kinase [Xanthocytophaga agilis]MDJ1504317.1 PAS domain-containing sensor histidine kinase [Xanthocytophaga agilis]